MFSKRILGFAIVAAFLLTACGGTSGNSQQYGPGDSPDKDSSGKYTAQIIRNLPQLYPNGYFLKSSNPRNPSCTREASHDGNYSDSFVLYVQLDYQSNAPAHAKLRRYTQMWGNIKTWLKEGDIVFFGPLEDLNPNHPQAIIGGSNFAKDFPFTEADITELWVDGKPVSRTTITFVCTGSSATASVMNEP